MHNWFQGEETSAVILRRLTSLAAMNTIPSYVDLMEVSEPETG